MATKKIFEMTTEEIMEYFEQRRNTELPPEPDEVVKVYEKMIKMDVKDIELEDLSMIADSEYATILMPILQMQWAAKLSKQISELSKKIIK